MPLTWGCWPLPGAAVVQSLVVTVLFFMSVPVQ
jgi:hypothetical protein